MLEQNLSGLFFICEKTAKLQSFFSRCVCHSAPTFRLIGYFRLFESSVFYGIISEAPLRLFELSFVDGIMSEAPVVLFCRQVFI